MAVFVILLAVLGRCGKSGLQPKWMASFIVEPKEDFEGLDFKPKKTFGKFTVVLLVLSIIGFVLQLLAGWKLENALPAASWVIAVLLVAAVRPKTAPKGLLVLFASILITQAIVLVDDRHGIYLSDNPAVLSVATAFISIVTILVMPLRDPERPNDEISPPFSEPTRDLRTPEDNITLWQFMTVSWMKPLIKLGNERQLNNEDVWDLGYEFKHRTLHDTFRELKGSVLRRLLDANGLDLLIMSLLSVIELTASLFFHPRTAT